MIVLGLTGSIGMGKSTASKIFNKLGIPVHDADKTVHNLLGIGGDAVANISALFPETEEKSACGRSFINRSALGKIVFQDTEKRKALEAILHPMVRARTDIFLEHHKKEGTPLVVLDIPLLFETGGEKRCDYVVVVTASAETQKNRVMAREGMTEEKFNAILASQLSDEEKRKRADFILFMENGIEAAEKQILQLLKGLTGHYPDGKRKKTDKRNRP